MLPYLLYLRKSTEEDERQAQSLESQENVGRSLALKLGVDVIVVEDAHSAKEPGRPVFEDVLAMIDRKEVGGLIAWHPDRLSRNEMDAAAICYRVRKKILTELHFCSYHFQNSNEGLMMLQFALTQSQYTSSKLTVDVRRGLDEKIQKGWWPHRALPGYVNDKHLDKGHKTISADPVRFPLIRRIFDHYLTGAYSGQQLLPLINDEWGYRSLKRRKVGGGPMTKTTLYRILSSIFYAGYFVENGQVYQGKHPPMITLEEHQRVQVLLGNVPRIQPKKHVFPYTGLIRCAACHKLITAQINTNRYGTTYEYYRCTRCRGHMVSGVDLERWIDSEVDRIHVPNEDFQKWAYAAVERFRDEHRQTTHAVHRQKLETLASIDGQLDSLLTALTKNLITEAEYAERRTRLQQERRLLKEETASMEIDADRARQAMENEIVFMSNVKTWLAQGDLATKRACVRALVSNFLLDHKKIVLEPHPLLKRVRDEYKGLEADYVAIQHNKTLSESTKQGRLEGVRSAWSHIWVYNQTLQEEQKLDFPNVQLVVVARS